MPSIQQQLVAQYQASGVMHGLLTTPQSTQSLPVAPVTLAVGSPNTSAHSQASHVPRNGTAVGIGADVFSQMDGSWMMSDVSAMQVHGKNMVKPLITEGLQFPSPSVNSLFGFPIPIDGEDDRWGATGDLNDLRERLLSVPTVMEDLEISRDFKTIF